MTNRKPRKHLPTRGTPPTKQFYWLYGLHAVRAALKNPMRLNQSLVTTSTGIQTLADLPKGNLRPELVTKEALTAILPAGAIHQGVARRAKPLQNPSLEEILADSKGPGHRPILVLDQVTDPRNVGAILRSAAAFSAIAVIVPNRHSPNESGAMAKSASGALDLVPMVRVPNLARALKQIGKHGFWRIGLDSKGSQRLRTAITTDPTALVLGGEGKGLRRLTRDECDGLARISIAPGVPSLNVSTTAAIALYELCRTDRGPENTR